MNSLKELENNLAYYFSEVLENPFAKPDWIYMSLSHKCTYKCQMCGVVKILKGYELENELIKKAFDEIASWNTDPTVVLTGGEPFLRKDIFEIINYSVINGIKIELVSNGALINTELATRIISSKLQSIAISIDGAKEATHDSIREQGAFRKAIKAINNLVSAKEKVGYGPQISVWATIMKENVSELFEIIPLVEKVGVDCLVYHPVIVAQDDMQNTSSSAPFWIREKDLDILKKELDRIVAYQAENGLVAFLHDPYLWIKYFEGKLTKKEWKCNPFVFINIGPDGEVRSCGASFGNLRNMSLEECLRTSESRGARRTMKLCAKPCLQTCWAHPESDSLPCIISSFIIKLESRDLSIQEQNNLLQGALDKVSEYEELLQNA